MVSSVLSKARKLEYWSEYSHSSNNIYIFFLNRENIIFWKSAKSSSTEFLVRNSSSQIQILFSSSFWSESHRVHWVRSRYLSFHRVTGQKLVESVESVESPFVSSSQPSSQFNRVSETGGDIHLRCSERRISPQNTLFRNMEIFVGKSRLPVLLFRVFGLPSPRQSFVIA